MLVETRKQTTRMISFRADDEMFFALKALSQMSGVDSSTLGRVAVASLIEKARKLEQPITWDDIKRVLNAELAND